MSAGTATLTDDDIGQIADQVHARRYRELNTLPSPKLPAPGTFDGDAMIIQERKRQERIKAHEEREAQAAREREAEEQRRREEWERNAPKREKAIASLARVEEKLRVLDVQRDELLREVRELREVASR